jgi:hypothetical protein
MKELPQETVSHLHNQLIKLGDMMGDGLHLEPDGKWISSEYRKICKTLGYIKPTKRNVSGINERMAQRTKDVSCGKCGGNLIQTRSGSKRAKCESCGAKWQLLK